MVDGDKTFVSKKRIKKNANLKYLLGKYIIEIMTPTRRRTGGTTRQSLRGVTFGNSSIIDMKIYMTNSE